MAVLFICAVLAVLAVATPQVNYPLNLQFPPVARVGEQFSFQFADTTFSAVPDSLQYSLIGNPSWLALDGKSRTLSGTPRADDVGIATFTIAAAAHAGAVANMEAKLLVSKDRALVPQQNISAELAQAGDLSGPRTISLRPSSVFNISFPPDLFASGEKELSYSATLADHTPLPAWLGFDGSLIRFAGTAPPTESLQSFDILLIACDTWRFASSVMPFTIVISKHRLFFDPFGQTVHLAKGNDIHIADIREKLFLDNLPIGNDQFQSASAELPSWLSFDSSTLEISGKAPADAMAQDVTVTATDCYGDTALQTIHLIFESKLFRDEISKLSLTVGEKFEYKIPATLLSKSDETLTLDFASLSSFLNFDSTSLVISGIVAADFPAQNVQCSITATSSDRTLQDTQQFQIEVFGSGNSAEGNPSKTGSRDRNDAGDALNTHGLGWDGKRTGVVVGSVIGAVCCMVILVAVMLCLRRRKKQRKSYISPKLPRSPRKSDISRPIISPHDWPEMVEIEDQGLEEGKGKFDLDLFVEDRAQEHPPKLDLNLPVNRRNLDLPVDRRDSNSVADSIGDDDTRILDASDESPFGLHNDITSSQHPHDSMRIPTESAKRASNQSDTFRKHKRRSTSVYQERIHRSTNLLVDRKTVGMGHGRHTFSPSRSNNIFSHSTLRRPLSTNSCATTRRTSIFSTAPSARPQPPKAQKHAMTVIRPTEQRLSFRIAPASSRSSIVDRRTIDERRNSYIRKRASAQSPFFSAGTRASSSSYRSPPAFIAEAQSSPGIALSPNLHEAIVKPDDDVVAGKEKEIPMSLRIVPPSGTFTETPQQDFPGSLRKNKASKHLTVVAAKRDRIEKSYARPRTAISSNTGSCTCRASSRRSLRAYELKASLNNLTGSKVYEDGEMSDSVYSDEEHDIEEAEKRATVKPSQFTLPPLKIDRFDTANTSKRDSRVGKRKSKQENRKELKRTSERDPTPYYIGAGHEHGGKENASSTYSLGQRSSPIRVTSRGKRKAITSTERPKPTRQTSYTTSEAAAAKPYCASIHRTSKARSHQESPQERHSRKSIHSRSQSGNITVKKARDRSRTQSTAYPYFEAKASDSLNTPRPGGSAALPVDTDPAHLPNSTTKTSFATRDFSGNLTFYGDEEPTIEELDSSSIGFRTSNGRINSAARNSQLASLHLSSHTQVPQVPPKSAKRQTVVPSSSPLRPVVGLGLYPQESPGDRARERAPLVVLRGENGWTPEPEEQGRRTWGSWKRWVSGGNWAKDDKVFI